MSKLTENDKREIASMCLTWRHDFGLMPEKEGAGLFTQMTQLYEHHVAPLANELWHIMQVLNDPAAVTLNMMWGNIAVPPADRLAELAIFAKARARDAATDKRSGKWEYRFRNIVGDMTEWQEGDGYLAAGFPDFERREVQPDLFTQGVR